MLLDVVLEAESKLRMEELTVEEREDMKAQQRGFIEQIKCLTSDNEEMDNKIWANQIKLSQALKEVC